MESHQLPLLAVAAAILSLIAPVFALLPHALVWVWASSSTVARLTPILTTAYLSQKPLMDRSNAPLWATSLLQLLVIGVIWVLAGLVRDGGFVSTTIYNYRSFIHDARYKRWLNVFQSDCRPRRLG
jgi:hypothetical protein